MQGNLDDDFDRMRRSYLQQSGGSAFIGHFFLIMGAECNTVYRKLIHFY